jgi:hypothetical protein
MPMALFGTSKELHRTISASRVSENRSHKLLISSPMEQQKQIKVSERTTVLRKCPVCETPLTIDYEGDEPVQAFCPRQDCGFYHKFE